ncbi:MAG: hypothetical protein U0263_03680 [Polyangiaceae bacterium]
MAAAPTEAAPASTPAASDGPAADIAAPPFYFATLLVVACVGATHEAQVVVPALYLGEASSLDRTLPLFTTIGAAALGVALGRQRFARPFPALCPSLAWAALTTAASAPLAFFAFGKGLAMAPLLSLHALAFGSAHGLALTLSARALSRTLYRLDAPWRLANPFRLLALVIGAGVAAGVASVVGPLRATLGIALVELAVALWVPNIHRHLEGRTFARAREQSLLAGSLIVLGFMLFAGYERLIPTAELHRHPNPIIHRRETPAARYSVTSGQEGFELFVNDHLRVSTLDERRYFEALVQPVMAAARSRARVLVLGGGTGLAEREVLRHADVVELVVVGVDRALPDLARKQRWLSQRSDGALDSGRLRFVEREPIVFVNETTESFDVIVADLPDPSGYAEGKYFTRYFYRKLAERLAPGGVFVVQALSPLSLPKTFADVLATLRAAGLETRPYQAAVPTLGVSGFVLAHHARLEGDLARALPYLSGATQLDLEYLAKDLVPKTVGSASTLHDQSVVDSFHREFR